MVEPGMFLEARKKQASQASIKHLSPTFRHHLSNKMGSRFEYYRFPVCTADTRRRAKSRGLGVEVRKDV